MQFRFQIAAGVCFYIVVRFATENKEYNHTLTSTILSANSTVDKLTDLLFIPQTIIDLDIPCILSPYKTIFIKCRSILEEKSLKMSSAEMFTQHAKRYDSE